MLTLLSDLTTLRVGGPTQAIVAASREELVAAVLANPDAFVLGGGSNVVMPDEGLPAVVLVRSRGIAVEGDTLLVEAGEDWDELVQWTLQAGAAGLEPMSGIPGTVGAAPVQNIGAYGGDLAPFVVGVVTLDRASGDVTELATADCGFGYRHSVFKGSPGRWVVLALRLRLVPGELSEPVRYAELAAALGVNLGDRVPTRDLRDAVLALRRRKGMVLDPADPDSVSAGSFFTNPVVAEAPVGAPSWPAQDGVKVSAAWLIEQAGFGKGWGDGRAGLSAKHTLAVVNRGGATAADLLGVARTVRDAVQDHFGITLVPEPVVVGNHL